MSGIAGVLRLDGGLVDPDDVAFLVEGLRHRGPSGVQDWQGDGVALVQALLRATPEAPNDAQPVADETGTVRVVFDGRLDNRNELRRALDAAGCRLRTDTDAEILLQCYRHWDRACATRLLGDFSFALWDEVRKRLFCARDPLGVKPFVYRFDGRRLAWSSDLRPIAMLPGAAGRPNLGMVAEFLASDITSRNDTVWEGVYRLPPAHTLTAEDHHLSLARYWDLDPAREVRHASHAEYAEHLRDLLASAVRDRMRTLGPVVVELSGGIDSSALMGLAAHEAARSSTKAGSVKAVSLTYPGRACDESEHIDAVGRFLGIEPARVTPVPAGTFDYEEQSRQHGDVPAYPVAALWTRLYLAARAYGANVTLSGIGGDEWFTGTAVYAGDLLRAGRLAELRAHLGAAARFHETSQATVAWQYGARALLAHSLPSGLADYLRGRTATKRAPWIRPEFARSVGLRERLLVPARRGLATIAQNQICHTVDGGVLTHSTEFVERFMAEFGLEPRLPFLDVRVLEFALAVPEAERWGSDRPKRLLRSAMHGLVPDSVVQRPDKPGPGYISAEQLLLPSTAALLRHPTIEQEGWVDGDRLRAMHARMSALYRRDAPGWDRDIWPLWRSLAVELWLRARSGV